jgi:hypothetical protein
VTALTEFQVMTILRPHRKNRRSLELIIRRAKQLLDELDESPAPGSG